jgi:hypothetical protein
MGFCMFLLDIKRWLFSRTGEADEVTVLAVWVGNANIAKKQLGAPNLGELYVLYVFWQPSVVGLETS